MKNLSKNFKVRKKGFTLIEMIIVIVIIGILAAAIIPKIIGVREKALDIKRLSEVRNLQQGLELFLLDNGEYPDVESDISNNLRISNCKHKPPYDEEYKKWKKLMEQLSPYLKEIPIDGNRPFCIYYLDDDESIPGCDEVKVGGYTILFTTHTSRFPNFRKHSEKKGGVRYCVNSP